MNPADRPSAELLAAFLGGAGPAIHQSFGHQRCCIAGTRAVLGVAAMAGVEAQALCVDAFATPPAWTDLIDRHGFDVLIGSDQGASQVALDCARSHGPYLFAGQKAEGQVPGFSGHVVAILEGRFMVDTSSAQFVRQDRGLEVPPSFHATVNARFLGGTEMWHERWHSPRGRSGLYYVARPGDRRFESIKAWNEVSCDEMARDLWASFRRAIGARRTAARAA